MRSVPPHWKLCKLGDVIRLKNGYAFKSNDYTEDGIPLIRISDINDNKVTVESAVRIPREKANADFYIESGDLLIAMSGATTGKTGVYNGQAPILQNQRVGNFKIIDENIVDKRYRNYYVTSLRKDIEKAAYGGAQPNISSKGIESFDFPLAPLNEQNLIVSEIEKQFSRLDEAVAALKRVRASLKRYKASVLKAAVEGKLTEEWRKQNPNVEPADKLLKRILAERKKKWEETNPKKKYKEPSAPDISNLPALPNGWVWAMVGQLCIISSGQTPKGIDKVSGKGTIPWFRVGDMNTTGNEKFMNVAEIYLTESEMEKLRLHTHSKGMIIFPKRGGAIATNKKRIISKPSTYDLNTMGLLPIVTQFEYFWNWFLSIDLGKLGDGSNVPQINNKDIEPLIVPLPPFAEQEKIATEVERRLSVIGEVDKEIDTNLRRAERLRQAILKKAFLGRLV